MVPADVRPTGKGSPAKFSWQTILVLRVAVLLRNDFKLELATHKMSFAKLRMDLKGKSFISLWGNRLTLRPDGGWALIDRDEPLPRGDFLVIELDPHLFILREGFALPDAKVGTDQLDLFSLSNVESRRRRTQNTRAQHRKSERKTA